MSPAPHTPTPGPSFDEITNEARRAAYAFGRGDDDADLEFSTLDALVARLVEQRADLLAALEAYERAAVTTRATLDNFDAGVAHPQEYTNAVSALKAAKRKARAALAKARGAAPEQEHGR